MELLFAVYFTSVRKHRSKKHGSNLRGLTQGCGFRDTDKSAFGNEPFSESKVDAGDSFKRSLLGAVTHAVIFLLSPPKPHRGMPRVFWTVTTVTSCKRPF